MFFLSSSLVHRDVIDLIASLIPSPLSMRMACWRMAAAFWQAFMVFSSALASVAGRRPCLKF